MQQPAGTEDDVTEVYTWGTNRYGQLGLGNNENGKCYNIPRFCSFGILIKEVACGEEHTAIITGQGQLYTFGSNSEGRLGLGDREMLQSCTPCLVSALAHNDVLTVACGWGHTAAILRTGELYTWGVGEYGALGLSGTESQWAPSKVAESFSAVAVSCGTRHTAVVSARGKVYLCGSGDAGQLGTGKREREAKLKEVTIGEPVAAAACGIFHTLMLTSAGNVFATGGNNFGQLGIGNKRSVMTPVRVSELDKLNIVQIAAGNHSGALTDKGDLYVWGTGTFGEYLLPRLFGEFAAPLADVAIGGLFGVVLDARGCLYSWGSNANGELGTGDFESRATPCLVEGLQSKTVAKVSCGGAYVMALGGGSNEESPSKQRLEVYSLEREEMLSESMEGRSNEGELAEAVSEERKRRARLEKQLKDLEEAQSMRRENGVGAMQLQDKIASLERQIEAEKKRGNGILKDINNMQANTIQAKSKPELEKRANTLQKEIEMLREENANLRAERITNRTSENSRLSDLLKDYEERIEREVEEKYRVMRNKQKEIANLRDTLPGLKAVINELERDKQKLEEHYRSEARNLEAIIGDCDAKMRQEEEVVRQLMESRERNVREAEELRSRLSFAVRKKDELTKEIENCKNDIDQVNFQVLNKQAELEQEASKYDSLQETLAAKEDAIRALREECVSKEGEYTEEITALRAQVGEKTCDNEDMESKVSVKQIEIDTLRKDAAAWQQVANNVVSENEALKRIVAGLEDKIRRLGSAREVQGAEFVGRSVAGNAAARALETYLPEDPSDEGRLLDQAERISDPYLQQRQALQDFERSPGGRY